MHRETPMNKYEPSPKTTQNRMTTVGAPKPQLKYAALCPSMQEQFDHAQLIRSRTDEYYKFKAKELKEQRELEDAKRAFENLTKTCSKLGEEAEELQEEIDDNEKNKFEGDAIKYYFLELVEKLKVACKTAEENNELIIKPFEPTIRYDDDAKKASREYHNTIINEVLNTNVNYVEKLEDYEKVLGNIDKDNGYLWDLYYDKNLRTATATYCLLTNDDPHKFLCVKLYRLPDLQWFATQDMNELDAIYNPQ